MVKKPTNTHALTLWLLIQKGNKGVTVIDAMKEYHSKFSTRLGELENVLDLKIIRTPLTLVHKFGHKVTVTCYKTMLSKKEINKLYIKINKKEWEKKLKN